MFKQIENNKLLTPLGSYILLPIIPFYPYTHTLISLLNLHILPRLTGPYSTRIMQNEPNLQNAHINTSQLYKVGYIKCPRACGVKNEPKRTQSSMLPILMGCIYAPTHITHSNRNKKLADKSQINRKQTQPPGLTARAFGLTKRPQEVKLVYSGNKELAGQQPTLAVCEVSAI